jgi:hypothetical protein
MQLEIVLFIWLYISAWGGSLLKNRDFWVVASCSSETGWLFDSEAVGDIFFRKARLSHAYMASQHRRSYFSQSPPWWLEIYRVLNCWYPCCELAVVGLSWSCWTSVSQLRLGWKLSISTVSVSAVASVLQEHLLVLARNLFRWPAYSTCGSGSEK